MNPLIVIVGETASGKSDLAIEFAQKYDGEIICADSRTIYQGMDIGTAKPSKEDQQKVPHYFLDIIEPNQTYSAAQFKQDVLKLLEDMKTRGKLPIMVGGSGLYVDSVIFDYQFSEIDMKKRDELNNVSLEELQKRALDLGIEETEVDFKNRRHLQRAVEAEKVLKNSQQLRPNTLLIGLKLDREVLEHRIKSRVDAMIEEGLVDEVKILGEKYGWASEAMSGIGYRVMGQYIRGEITLEEAKQKLVQGDLNLAKRQRTWFKRNKYIHWIDNSKSADTLVKTFLSHVE
jgi:tRNA dimethylallyltransferase